MFIIILIIPIKIKFFINQFFIINFFQNLKVFIEILNKSLLIDFLINSIHSSLFKDLLKMFNINH